MMRAFAAAEGVIRHRDFAFFPNRLVKRLTVRLNFIGLAHLSVEHVDLGNDLLQHALGAFG